MAQLDDHTVRGIALNPTQGMARGMAVETNGTELTVPVGKEILGRRFDVFGNTIDHGEPLKQMQQRNVHQPPPPLADRSTNPKYL